MCACVHVCICVRMGHRSIRDTKNKLTVVNSTVITNSQPLPPTTTQTHLHHFIAIVQEDREKGKHLSSCGIIVVSQHGHNLKGQGQHHSLTGVHTYSTYIHIYTQCTLNYDTYVYSQSNTIH